MSTAEQKPNPVIELVQLFRRHPDSFTLCVFHYEKALFRLSADQIRHYLTMEDDALLFLLSRMQPDGCEFNPAWWYGWRVLIQAMGEWPDLQVFSCNKRLFWKVVLRHANLLCTAGSDLFQAAASMCKALLSPPEATSKVIYDLTQFGRVACNVACFFLMLLMETNKAEHARFMADVLRSFNDFFMSADSVLTTHWSGNKEISEPLLLARKHGSVLIERMVAAVPADCWDDDVARSILSHACALMDELAKQMPSRSPQELLHCTLVTMAEERVTFCKTYVERTEKDEPVSDVLCETKVPVLSPVFLVLFFWLFCSIS